MPRRVLALDLGTARTGVAVSDATATLARPLETVAAGDHARIAALVDAEEVGVVLVGLPRNMDGSRGPAARAAEAEAAVLGAALPVPVQLVDERLTTVSADRALRASGRGGRARRRIVDQVAATVLLQGWLDGAAGAAWRAANPTPGQAPN